jgi:hypothetical protein
MIDIKKLNIKEKVELFKQLYKDISSKGIKGDTELAHINEFEKKLLIMHGGSGTINPETGLRQYFGGEVEDDQLNQTLLLSMYEKLLV